MHGELLKARCVHCEAVVPWREDLGVVDRCPSCAQARGLRPHVVWFGEMPMELETIYEQLAEAELFVAIGTSGSVYPAAGFVDTARLQGIRRCEINLEPSNNARAFDDRRYGAASETVPAWVDDMLGREQR
jgi:NAD-dependent deacetylase